MSNKLKSSLKRMTAFLLSLVIVSTSVSLSSVSVIADDIAGETEAQLVADDVEFAEDDYVLTEAVDGGELITVDSDDEEIIENDVVINNGAENDIIVNDTMEDAIVGDVTDIDNEDATNYAGATLDKPEILYVRQAGDGKGALKVIFKKIAGVASYTISLTRTIQEAQKEIIETRKEVSIDASEVPECPKEKADNRTGYLAYVLKLGITGDYDDLRNTFIHVSANAINDSVASSEDKKEVKYIYENGLFDIDFDPTVKELCDYSVEHSTMKPYKEIDDDYIGDEEVAGKYARIKIAPKSTPEDPDGTGFVIKGVGIRYTSLDGKPHLKYATAVLKPNKKSVDYWTFKMPAANVKIHMVKGDEEMEEPDEWDISGNEIEEPVVLPEDDVTLGDDIIAEDKSYPNRIDLALKATATKVSYKASHTYTGLYIKPSVKVTVMENGKRITLVEGTDYIKEYKYNRDCRILDSTSSEESPKPLIIIHGNGHYKGIVRYSFEIKKKSIKKCKAFVDTMSTEYHEYKVEDRIKIYDGNKLLVQYKDYSLDMSKENFDKKGTTYVYATGEGNYKGKLKIPVKVIKLNEKTKLIASASMNAAKLDKLVFKGKAHTFKPKHFTVYTEDGTVVPTKYYKVTARRVKNSGTGYVKITGKGKKYKGSIVIPVDIRRPDVEFTASEIKDQVYSGTLRRPKPTVKVELNGKKKKLKLNKDYKITYIDNLYALKDKEYAYARISGIGNYAGVKPLTVKFAIKPYDIKKVKATGTKKEGITLTFNGKQLVKGIDFDYDERAGWKDDLPEGIYTKIVITGLKNFYGSSYEGKFLIKPVEKKEAKKKEAEKKEPDKKETTTTDESAKK